MNLQEALDYRSDCIICGRKMKTKSLDLAGITMTRTAEGLYVEGGTKDYSCYFKFDGTYERSKKWYPTYVRPLSILRECVKCIPKSIDKPFVPKTITPGSMPPGAIILKARSVGMTTMNASLNLMYSSLANLKEKRCAYTFKLFGDAENNFTCELNWEDIQFCEHNNFTHFKTDFSINQTQIKSGNTKTDTLDSMMKLEVPSINASKLLTKDSLINKIKLYNLFS